MADPWSQDGYRCRLEWGHHGARVAAERGDVLVVIDVLRFSTATVTTVQHGGIIFGHVRAIAFSPDGQFLASSNDWSIRIWRTSDGVQTRVLGADSHDIPGIAFSPDGHLLAAPNNNGSTIRIWRLP